jgi:predicted naringenin-chalcone synthase
VDGFLAGSNRTRSEIAFWAIQPRSPELLDAAAASLDLPESALAASRAVWRRRGNMISASLFHVLDELRTAAPPAAGQLGMMISFGAGFGCEMVLLRAAGWLSH